MFRRKGREAGNGYTVDRDGIIRVIVRGPHEMPARLRQSASGWLDQLTICTAAARKPAVIKKVTTKKAPPAPMAPVHSRKVTALTALFTPLCICLPLGIVPLSVQRLKGLIVDK